jgi:ligand-binding sensor domain-containing protein
MFQDKNGDMWFATDRGIAKYDGFNFKVFDVSTGLLSNTIFDFFSQKDGTVWCSTTNNSCFILKMEPSNS